MAKATWTFSRTSLSERTVVSEKGLMSNREREREREESNQWGRIRGRWPYLIDHLCTSLHQPTESIITKERLITAQVVLWLSEKIGFHETAHSQLIPTAAGKLKGGVV